MRSTKALFAHDWADRLERVLSAPSNAALVQRLLLHAEMHGNVSPHDAEQAQWERDLLEAARLLSAQGEAVATIVAYKTGGGRTLQYAELDLHRLPVGTKLSTNPAPARVTEEARARHMDAVKEALSRWPEALPAIHFMSAALGPHDPITADDIAWAAAALEADHG